VDRLLGRIFELDSLVVFGDPGAHAPDSPVGSPQATPDRGKSANASPDEQDLADFLGAGYFVPGDLLPVARER
jgi:hypothetical protein